MFRGLFGKKKNASPSVRSAPKLSSSVSGSILNVVGSRGIPPMPGAAQKAFKLAVDPNAEARDFIDVIESDEGLSARILKIANSVFFDRGKPSKTIEEAVLVIGINELRCLLNATSLAELFPSSNSARTYAWANDIATALIARQLAGRLMPSKTEMAFLGGLMHDIGKLVLIQRAGGEYARVVTKVQETGAPFREAEADIFPFDHCEVGLLVGERWNFTPDLNAVIRHHHAPLSGSVTLPSLVGCADTIAHSLGLGHGKGFARLRSRAEESLPEVWGHLGIPEEDRKAFLQQASRTYDSEYELYAGTQFK